LVAAHLGTPNFYPYHISYEESQYQYVYLSSYHRDRLSNQYLASSMTQSEEHHEELPALPVSEKQAPADVDNHDYPTGWRLALIMTAMFTGMFLVALVCSTPSSSLCRRYPRRLSGRRLCSIPAVDIACPAPSMTVGII
jgi:hypothetical protein